MLCRCAKIVVLHILELFVLYVWYIFGFPLQFWIIPLYCIFGVFSLDWVFCYVFLNFAVSIYRFASCFICSHPGGRTSRFIRLPADLSNGLTETHSPCFSWYRSIIGDVMAYHIIFNKGFWYWVWDIWFDCLRYLFLFLSIYLFQILRLLYTRNHQWIWQCILRVVFRSHCNLQFIYHKRISLQWQRCFTVVFSCCIRISVYWYN